MRLLCCGDRNWTQKWIIREYLKKIIQYNPIECIIEGEARGADSIARDIAEELDIQVLKFPANWVKYGRAAGSIRNQQMLVEGKPTHVAVFHDNLKNSKGSKDMATRALKNNISVFVVQDRACFYTVKGLLDVKEIESV